MVGEVIKSIIGVCFGQLIQFSHVNEWRALEKKGENIVKLSSPDNSWGVEAEPDKAEKCIVRSQDGGECSEALCIAK